MNESTDQQLLRDYAEDQSEAAFAEIVRRYVDLVHSAALRMVGDPHTAKDVTQAVFVLLAQQARQLAERPAVAGWLHGTTRNLAAKAVRSDVRRRAREQEAAAMNELLSACPDTRWEHIAPQLDDALGELTEPDREALLLRYFQNHDLRTVGATLGISDDAAQKRVSRAVERLREFFAKRGITVGAGGLAVVISANAVQAAPVGLCAAITAAGALAGTTIATTATKAIVMTTLQKTLITATILAAVGTGFYEARQSSQLRNQNHTLQQQQTQLAAQIHQLNLNYADATNRLVALVDENQRLSGNTYEVAKLRGEITKLRQVNQPPDESQLAEMQPFVARYFYSRAMKQNTTHDYEAALINLSRAIELDPKFTEALFSRACIYDGSLPLEKREYAKAVDDYSRLLKLTPNDTSAWHNRALCYEGLHRYDEAIADYTTIIEGNTDFSRIIDGKDKQLALEYQYRGRAYDWYKKDYARAIADYTEALRLDPKIEMAHQYRGQCYEALGQGDKAQGDFAAEKARNN